MARAKSIRFAVGAPEAPQSCIWRMVTDKDDVYVGMSKWAMGKFKLSLHKSGVWVFAATKESGMAFDGENRRAKQWLRPTEHSPGITRGPSILVPHTSLGLRRVPPGELTKHVHWFAVPSVGHTVEFSMYFVAAGAKPSWSASQTVIANLDLRSKSNLTLLADFRETDEEFERACSDWIVDATLTSSDPSDVDQTSLLWVTKSRDVWSVPMIVDLPVIVRNSE